MVNSLDDANHPGTLAEISYFAHGAIQTLLNGCSAGGGCVRRLETYDCNSRLQPKRILLDGNPLGSTMFVTNHYGVTDQKTLYGPYGELIAQAGAAARDPRFAGMEQRDAETDFDPTPARLYQNRIYRWMSPDPIGKKAAKLTDPQTWNVYAYVRNNPTTFTDPTGLDLWLRGCGKEGKTCHNNYVGTWDKGHKNFAPTTIQSDKNGNFVWHKVAMDTSGIKIDGKYTGVFACGTASTVINGTGNLSGFRGTFSTNCLGTCAAGGMLTALPGHSFSELLPRLVGPDKSLDVLSGHEGRQYRGGNLQGPDFHLSYVAGQNQQSMHFDWRYPFGPWSGLLEHAQDFLIYEERSTSWATDPTYDFVHPSDEE